MIKKVWANRFKSLQILKKLYVCPQNLKKIAYAGISLRKFCLVSPFSLQRGHGERTSVLKLVIYQVSLKDGTSIKTDLFFIF